MLKPHAADNPVPPPPPRVIVSTLLIDDREKLKSYPKPRRFELVELNDARDRRSPANFTTAWSDDVDHLIEHARRQYPSCRVVVDHATGLDVAIIKGHDSDRMDIDRRAIAAGYALAAEAQRKDVANAIVNKAVAVIRRQVDRLAELLRLEHHKEADIDEQAGKVRTAVRDAVAVDRIARHPPIKGEP